MEIRNYCYTRGEFPDYRNFAIPDNLNSKEIETVKMIVKPIVDSPSALTEPVWVLYKTNKIIVWGICCFNNELSNQYHIDGAKRQVTGFFAISISDYSIVELSLPFDISFFKELYKTDVEPYWFCRENEDHTSHKNNLGNDFYRSIKASENKYLSLLNTDLFVSKRFGESNIEGVLSSALTVDTISLVVGYDGTINAPNAKVPVMNSIMEGAREKVVPVKRTCPECGKMVSHFMSSGICDKCEERKKVIDRPTDSDMDSKKLDRIKRKLRDCQYDIEEKEKTIKRLNRRIKILWILCGLLLIICLWLFKRSDIRLNPLFASERPSALKTSFIDAQEPHIFLNVDSSTVDVPAEGQDSLTVGWKTNCPQVEAETNGVDWVNIVNKTKDSVFLCIQRSKSSAERVAYLFLSTSEGNKRTIEIHQQAAQ